jgi:multiple sugar transport system substrate-binding protein
MPWYPSPRGLAEPTWSSQTSDFFGGQKVNELFGGIANSVDANFQWLPFMEYVYSSAQDTMTPAITNKGDLVAAMKAWEAALKTYATQQGFTVA